MLLTGIPTLIAAVWYPAKAIIWGFPQEGQRNFWEKIHGTPEGRAAKKRERTGEGRAVAA